MNIVTLVFGLTLIGAGVVTLVRRVHDRSVQETILVLKNPVRDAPSGVSAFVGLLVPIVSSIAGGLAFVAISALGW